jgi:hypothetical protein
MKSKFILWALESPAAKLSTLAKIPDFTLYEVIFSSSRPNETPQLMVQTRTAVSKASEKSTQRTIQLQSKTV